jgi:hypothetical protein
MARKPGSATISLLYNLVKAAHRADRNAANRRVYVGALLAEVEFPMTATVIRRVFPVRSLILHISSYSIDSML